VSLEGGSASDHARLIPSGIALTGGSRKYCGPVDSRSLPSWHLLTLRIRRRSTGAPAFLTSMSMRSTRPMGVGQLPHVQPAVCALLTRVGYEPVMRFRVGTRIELPFKVTFWWRGAGGFIEEGLDAVRSALARVPADLRTSCCVPTSR